MRQEAGCKRRAFLVANRQYLGRNWTNLSANPLNDVKVEERRENENRKKMSTKVFQSEQVKVLRMFTPRKRISVASSRAIFQYNILDSRLLSQSTKLCVSYLSLSGQFSDWPMFVNMLDMRAKKHTVHPFLTVSICINIQSLSSLLGRTRYEFYM